MFVAINVDGALKTTGKFIEHPRTVRDSGCTDLVALESRSYAT